MATYTQKELEAMPPTPIKGVESDNSNAGKYIWWAPSGYKYQHGVQLIALPFILVKLYAILFVPAKRLYDYFWLTGKDTSVNSLASGYLLFVAFRWILFIIPIYLIRKKLDSVSCNKDGQSGVGIIAYGVSIITTLIVSGLLSIWEKYVVLDKTLGAITAAEYPTMLAIKGPITVIVGSLILLSLPLLLAGSNSKGYHWW